MHRLRRHKELGKPRVVARGRMLLPERVGGTTDRERLYEQVEASLRERLAAQGITARNVRVSSQATDARRARWGAVIETSEHGSFAVSFWVSPFGRAWYAVRPLTSGSDLVGADAMDVHG